MAYLIDGHNLIPKIQGLSLAEMDDEEHLIELLQVFSRVRRQKVEVYFDRAPAGQKKERNYGTIKAHFIRQGTSADVAIIARLHRLGKSARDWSVVTSDRQIQGEARARQAQVVTSEEFARQIEAALQKGQSSQVSEKEMSDAEIAEWLKLFQSRK
jgi:uncharacterized protein